MENPPPPPPPPSARPDWGRRILLVAIVLIAVVVIALIASAVIPRWWAQTVGRQAGGGMISGSGLGLFYGFVFTLIPLAVVWLTFRARRAAKLWAAGLIAALVLALPNLMTLAIVMGTGNAAHAGERIMDVEAPGFRGGSLIGAVVAGVGFGFWRYQMAMRRRAQRRADRLEGDLRRATAPPPEGDGEGL